MARRAIQEKLGDDLEPATLYDALLMVSELVTNSMQHARLDSGDTIELSIRLNVSSGVARVEVSDPGPGFEAHVSRARLSSSGGRGLSLVAQLAVRWGVKTNGTTVVWFELPT
jgi:two-component sensor histidine kinase